MPRNLEIILRGPPASGKSTLAREIFYKIPNIPAAVGRQIILEDGNGMESFSGNEALGTIWIKTEYSKTETTAIHDPVNHPKHYTTHPSGVECIEITRHFNFNRGSAIGYIWRAGKKEDEIEDLRKARWHIDDEIKLLERKREKGAGHE